MGVKRNALIVLNGEPPSQALLLAAWSQADLRVSADGAAATCLRYGLRPDVVLGDFDSLPEDLASQLPTGTRLKMPDQNTSDGEKAIRYCLENDCAHIVILGATGKRVDHCLYNIGLLKRYQRPDVCLVIRTEVDEIRLITGPETFRRPRGTRISLLPVFGRVEGVVTEGLAFPLQGQDLELGSVSSLSNVFSDETARVVFNRGALLVILASKDSVVAENAT
jgi:thiamine pyrophosphokinase